MPSLRTQSDLRPIQRLPFCYLCAQPITDDERRKKLIDREHLPPKACFAKPDRTPTLVLPTHRTCNNSHSDQDEVLGQLVATQHGTPPNPKSVSRLRTSLLPFPGATGMLTSVEGLPLRRMIARCVRGFHAALYRVPLHDMSGYVCEPLPSSDDGTSINQIPPMQFEIVKTLKANRLADCIDAIETNNGKCRYFATWTRLDPRYQLDAGIPVCFFAFDMYEWAGLAAGTPVPPRSCVGWYVAGPAGFPLGAARATELVFRFSNMQALDPFGS